MSKNLNDQKLEKLISDCLNDFYQSRLQRLDKLKLKTILRRKNPYLFKALSFLTVKQLKSMIPKCDFYYDNDNKDLMILNLLCSLRRKKIDNLEEYEFKIDYLLSDYIKFPVVVLDFIEENYDTCNKEFQKLLFSK